MYRRCYRYEDMMPAATVRTRRESQFPIEAQPKAEKFPTQTKAESNFLYAKENIADESTAENIPELLSKETAEEQQPLSFTQGMSSSLKGIYENVRSQLIRDGKVLGFLETDDLIILLLIVILIAEECDDYILLLGLAALIFLK